MWYISSNVNNGYPYNTDFVGIISDIWTDGKHNYSMPNYITTDESSDARIMKKK